ncbi:sigma-70 family RNA polymerase sigma factor [Kolteria novifilia]
MLTAEFQRETESLLQQVREGDRLALNKLMDRSRSYLTQVMKLQFDPALRKRVDESDVVQETLLNACHRMQDFLDRKPMPYLIWLRKNAQERLIMQRRRHLSAEKRTLRGEITENSSILLADLLPAANDQPRQELERKELIAKVRDALTQLSEDDQEILLMRQVEGLSNSEAAKVLDLTTSAASKRYGRALLRLRRAARNLGLGESAV